MIQMISAGIGRLHPVFVHLPIGILLFAALLFFASKKQKFANLAAAVAPALAIGSFFSILSCITGYLLSISDAYNEDIIFKHQWLGIATALTSIVCYFMYQKKSAMFGTLIIVLTTLIMVTGHYGGTLTHGADYLTASFNSTTETKKVIANIDEAVVYTDIIEPILATKCYSCHGQSKQKGKLRLDLPNYIMQGGEEGKVLTPYQPGSSEMINRILLPTANEDHMPPVQKPQLTKDEVALLHWWIESGANFTAAVKNTKQTAAIKGLLASFSSGDATAAEQTKLPTKKVSAISSDILSALTKEGITVVPVVHGSNYVRANLIGVEKITTHTIELLSTISDQLLQLNASFTGITNEHLNALSNCKTLKQLFLNSTAITDKGLNALAGLENLETLSITQTKTTEAGINGLSSLKNLKKVFLYGTGFTKGSLTQLQQKIQGLIIDTGGYKIPILVTDTTEAKAPEVKTN
ncbi:MAG: c-type cytochrome domain-containing protein [Sediminibacterium sp.]